MKTYVVFYRRDSESRYDLSLTKTDVISGKTHNLLKFESADSLHSLFNKLQEEVWSPEGEANELIKAKGLMHTSMSSGDCAMELSTGLIWECHAYGWRQLSDIPEAGSDGMISVTRSMWDELPDEYKGKISGHRFALLEGYNTVVSGCISSIMGNLFIEGADFQIVEG